MGDERFGLSDSSGRSAPTSRCHSTHRTSLPLKCLIRDNLLHNQTSFSTMAVAMVTISTRWRGWVSTVVVGSAYRPDDERVEADIVNLGTLSCDRACGEARRCSRRLEVGEVGCCLWRLVLLSMASAMAIWSLATASSPYSTFQKYYTQLELRAISSNAVRGSGASCAGVFYVFRMRHCANRLRLHAIDGAPLLRAPCRESSSIDIESCSTALIDVASELGRLPFHDEFARTDEVLAHFCRRSGPSNSYAKSPARILDKLRQSKIDDLRVYLALARFPKRPAFTQMPIAMQRDIKEFFGVL